VTVVLGDVLLRESKFIYSFWRAVWRVSEVLILRLKEKIKAMLVNLDIYECL